jgi:NAD(P) transhydrogenase
MTSHHYDLVVIGSGPAGQKGAIAAAKMGKRVAIVDREAMIGGVSLNTGTIPSKTLREAILYLTGLRQRAFYGQDYKLKQEISVSDLKSRVASVRQREKEVIHQQLSRNDIRIINGAARFVDPNRLEVDNDGDITTVTCDHVLIACGTRPARSSDIPFDGKRILDADQLRVIETIPRDLIVVGAGVIGVEFASMFAALGLSVTIIEQRPTLLDFVDGEILEALRFYLRRLGVVFRLGEKVTGVEKDSQERVHASMDSGKRVHADGLLYAVGRQVNTDLVNAKAVGLNLDPRGRVVVNEHFQTNVPHIYAAGDCIGFPSLASTSMEQGRLAVHYMFQGPQPAKAVLFPYGIYTIPEISMIGKTEHELTEEKVPYEVGIARYSEIAKGQMAGDDSGMLKLLFNRDTLRLLGVHVIGESATEIIHVGQTVLAFEGTIEYFRDTVFNYPTFAETYKVAALNGLNKL